MVYAPTMISSPYAKFMRPMTPNSSESDSAISANRLPYAIESIAYWT